MPTQRETVLITGASGGIGYELAREFAKRGFDLVVVARRAAQLDALAKQCRVDFDARVDVRPCDLLAPDAVETLVAELERDGLVIDVLVNNAGVIDTGDFAEVELANHERLLQLNVVVLTTLTRRLLPGMLARGRGRILNVASTSAFQPVPSLALYAASKAFVLSLSESLSVELGDTPVTVTALCPGFTRTEMLERAQDGHAPAQGIPDFMISEVGDVAREGVDACLAGTVVAVPGRPNQLLASSVGFYPRWLVRGVTGWFRRGSND